MVDSLLAYLYAPIHPLVKKIKLRREGPRGHNPRDILLPEGYTAEVVATGLNAPVHCCFTQIPLANPFWARAHAERGARRAKRD